MSSKPVEAVLFWRYNISAFRATYGRLGPKGGYTRDFVQASDDQEKLIDRLFGLPEAKRPVPIEFAWPGVRKPANLILVPSDKRVNLRWDGANLPTPWGVGDPDTDPAVVLKGSRTETDAAKADAVWQAIENAGIRPWLLAIKLHGEDGVLHLRAVLENPPAGLEAAGVASLPASLRQAIAEYGKSGDTGCIAFAHVRAPKLAKRILSALATGPNVLVIGPPGTGKSVVLEDIRSLYETGSAAVCFDPDIARGGWSESVTALSSHKQSKVISVVFHPSYGYEEFVAGVVPAPHPSGGMALQTRAGPLLSLANWAMDDGRQGLLLIDEFNRGPAAATFGDTLALLDAEKRCCISRGRLGASIRRPYADDPAMAVDDEYARANGDKKLPTQLRLPETLHIVAALNSTDRSIAPLDAALRRRFSIIVADPDYEVLAKHFGIPGAENVAFTPSANSEDAWNAADVRRLAVALLQALNQRIAFILGTDFLLGHALIWNIAGDSREVAAESLSHVFEEKVLGTLRLSFIDQDEALAAVLKAGPMPTAPVANEPLALAQWSMPPADLAAVSAPRLSLSPIAEIAMHDHIRALRMLRRTL